MTVENRERRAVFPDPRHLLDAVVDAIIVLDVDLNVTFQNAAARELIESGLESVGHALGLVHEDDHDMVMNSLAVLAAEPGKQVSVRFRVDVGEMRPVQAIATNMLDEPGIEGYVVCFRNLEREESARRDLAAQRELAAANEHLRSVLEEREALLKRLLAIQRSISRRAPMPEVLDAVVRGARDLFSAEVVVLRLTDPTSPNMLSLAASQGIPDQYLASVVAVRPGEGLSGRAYLHNDLVDTNVDATAVLASGDHPTRAGLAVPIRDGERPIGSLAVFQISEDRVYTETEKQMLRFLADHAGIALVDSMSTEATQQDLMDPLTGLPSRRLLLDRLESTIERSRQSKTERPVAVLCIDIDRLKDINGGHGREWGDAVLEVVAHRIRSVLRSSDMASRAGGHEFIVVLDNAGSKVAATIAERLLHALREPIVYSKGVVHIDASIGIAMLSTDERGDDVITAGRMEEAENLVRQADIAMQRAKDSAQGQAMIFEPRMQSAIVTAVALENELRAAIRDGNIDVHFQLVTDLRTGAIHGVEALARWTSRAQGVVPPSTFVLLAEETGTVQDLDRLVMRHACRAMLDVSDPMTGRPLFVNVNVSCRYLHQPEIVTDVLLALEETGFPASRLVIELTETDLMRDSAAALDRLTALKDIGVAIAIDDFGTGYSSLAYLQQFPVDLLKIDRTFVADVADGARGHHLAQAMIGLAHALDLRVVAEGIETSAQADALRLLGSDLGQGFLFAKPVSQVELASLLRVPARLT